MERERKPRESVAGKAGLRLRDFFSPMDPDEEMSGNYSEIHRLLGNLSEAPFGGRYAQAINELRMYCIQHQDELLEVMKSGTVTDREASRLLWIGGHAGSVALRDNVSWLPFLQRVWSEKDSMPAEVVSTLEWWFRVHAPGLSEGSTPTTLCVMLLESILLTDESFDREQAIRRLTDMKDGGEISMLEFLQLVDAANKYAKDGHFKNSLIYGQALADEEK